MGQLFEITTKYLQLVERFSDDRAAFDHLLHPDFEQIELPNVLNPGGQRSNRDRAFERLQTARQVLSAQRIEITGHCEDASRLFVEAIWKGTMAIDAGPLRRGQLLTAYFCMAFEFAGGQIVRQRNYDCFEPFQ